MAEKHMSHDEFFTGLSDLLAKTAKSAHGSIYLTQKRFTHGQDPKSSDSLADNTSLDPQPLLLRATNGKSKEHRLAGEKSKLSTIVQPDDLEGFYLKYADVCKTGMQALKKRDRSKRKKGKDKKKGEKKG